jgi:hypothetical protein
MSAELLLSKLHRVKRLGPGKWSASCPTREDKSPSLSVRELDDGTVLLHDFGGDSVEAILGALGMTFNDLYPAKPERHFSRPVRRPFSPSEVLALVAFEASVAVLVVSDVLKGKATEADLKRLLVAAQRLGNAAEVCNGQR